MEQGQLEMWDKATPLSHEEIKAWEPLMASITCARTLRRCSSWCTSLLHPAVRDDLRVTKVRGDDATAGAARGDLPHALPKRAWSRVKDCPHLRHGVRGHQDYVLLHVRIVVVPPQYFSEYFHNFPFDLVAMPEVRWWW